MIKEIVEHRSQRSFTGELIQKDVLDRILECTSRASTTGNMQLYSIVITEDQERKMELGKCHFSQPMIEKSSMLVTFCADVNRFSKWCEQRDADPAYHNFLWFMNGSIDAILASQNFSLAAQHEGLGICYLGTTLYTAKRIIELLKLPKGVIPITTLAVGYPDQLPPLTDRLPNKAIVHYEQYEDYTSETIDDLWAQREASQETQKLLEDNQLDNLAKIFTQNRYKRSDNIAISESLLEIVKEQGFFDL